MSIPKNWPISFHPIILKLGDSVLEFIGELSRKVINDYDFRSKPCVAELDFNILIDKTNLEGSYHKIPLFPIVTRDLAVVTDEKITWADIKECIESLKIDYLGNMEFFDVYMSKQVGKGKKSIAFKLIFRAEDKTLKSEEVDALQEKSLQILTIPMELSCALGNIFKIFYRKGERNESTRSVESSIREYFSCCPGNWSV